MSQTLAEDVARLPMSSPLAATLTRAAQYAGQQGHGRVTLEHMLMALTEDPDAQLVLAASAVSNERVSADVATHLAVTEPAGEGAPSTPLGLAPELKRVLEAAAVAAQQGRRQVTGAIVLAAIVGEGKSTAAEVLRAQGMTFEGAIKALQRSAQRPSAPAQAPTSPPPSPPAVPKVAAPPTPFPAASDSAVPPAPAAATVPAPASASAEAAQTSPALAVAPPAPPQTPVAVPQAQAIVEPQSQPPALPKRVPPALPPQLPEARSAPPAPPLRLKPAPAPAAFGSPPVDDGAASAERPPSSVPSARGEASPRPIVPPPPRPPATPLRAPPPPPPPPPVSGRAQPDQSALPSLPASEPFSPAPVAYANGADGRIYVPTPVPPWPGGELPDAYLPPATGDRYGLPAPYQAPPLPVPVAPFDPPEGAGGQFIESIPRSMRVGEAVVVEVRLMGEPMHTAAHGAARAVTVRLTAPGGAFVVATEAAETAWVENPGLPGQPLARWRWTVIPQLRGRCKLQLHVATRWAGPGGLSREVPLPAEEIEVRVKRNLGAALRNAVSRFGWIAFGVALGLLAGSTLPLLTRAFRSLGPN